MGRGAGGGGRGDGTMNEVANGIHAHRAAHPGSDIRPRLGIVPLGTGNDLASALEIPADVEAAMEIAVAGSTRFVDVASVGGRCFLNVSTGGIGAEATEEASPEVKRILGRVAYMITGARKFVGLHPSSARFTAGEVVYDGPFLLYAVGNSRLTGGGNLLTPRAEMDDGLLDLCVVGEVSRMEFAKLLPLLRTGEHLDHPAVLYRQVPRVTVESGEELSVNADGEPVQGCRQLEYGISPHRLALSVP